LSFIKQGNEQALEALYERYYKLLCLKAYKRIPSTPLVEEVVQDVFVNLWVKSASLDVHGNVKAYLYATLRNKILHELRQESTRALYADKIRQLSREREEIQSLESLYARDAEARIHRVIGTLSPQCRRAFLLSRFENLSYKQIATSMNISVNTVEKHVAKALRVLKGKLQEYKDIIQILIVILFLINRS
jgi:RNA polymerase sigma-70 factor (ECF subfamily)